MNRADPLGLAELERMTPWAVVGTQNFYLDETQATYEYSSEQISATFADLAHGMGSHGVGFWGQALPVDNPNARNTVRIVVVPDITKTPKGRPAYYDDGTIMIGKNTPLKSTDHEIVHPFRAKDKYTVTEKDKDGRATKTEPLPHYENSLMGDLGGTLAAGSVDEILTSKKNTCIGPLQCR